MWNSTDRMLSRGQRCFARHQYDEALECFGEARRRAPKDPHVHIYHARAASELGRLDEALVSCDAAESIAPSNFVFPMFRGIICLDNGRHDDARRALARSGELETSNKVLEGYQLLADWDSGIDGAFGQLSRGLRPLPISFHARIAIRIEARGVPASAATMDADQSRTQWQPARILVQRWRAGVSRRRSERIRRQLESVGTLVDGGQFEKALSQLEAIDGLRGDVAREYKTLRARTGEGLCKELRDRLRELEAASPASNDSNKADKRATLTAAERRKTLLKLASCLQDAGKTDESHATFLSWTEHFQSAGSPNSERTTAGLVFLELAAIELRHHHPDRAAHHCAEARPFTQDPRADLLQAKAELHQGHSFAARRYFERYISTDLLYVERRIEEMLARP